MNYRLGWLPDLPDYRDYKAEHPKVQSLLVQSTPLAAKTGPTRPATCDLREHCAPIEDQKDLGSCTAHAGVGLMEYFQRAAFGRNLDMSRLFLYKTARRLAGIAGDEGCYLRSTMQAMCMLGIPPESMWPYKVADFNKEPDAFIYSLADDYKAWCYYKLESGQNRQLLDVLRDSLAAGLPFMFGFTVYSSMTDNEWIPIPKKGEHVEGGHAVVAVGYDDARQAFRIRNSWGKTWGKLGYGWLPYWYMQNGQAEDFWTLVSAGFVDTELFKV